MALALGEVGIHLLVKHLLLLELADDIFKLRMIGADEFLRAQELGVNLIDGDHFCTETPVIPALREKLAQRFPDVQFLVSKSLHQTVCFL